MDPLFSSDDRDKAEPTDEQLIVEEEDGPTENSENLVTFAEKTEYYLDYKGAVQAAVNFVLYNKFDLKKHEKKVTLDSRFWSVVALYPSKGTESIPKDQICGLGEKREKPHDPTTYIDFIRLDRGPDPRDKHKKKEDQRILVHFNAKYVGKSKNVPNNPHKAGVFIDRDVSDEEFKRWADAVKDVKDKKTLWAAWSNGNEPPSTT